MAKFSWSKKHISDVKQTDEVQIGSKKDIHWPFFDSDLNFTSLLKQPSKQTKPPFKINWVIPPMGKGSGGHTDIFRIAQYLEKQGHICRFYVYDASSIFDENLIKQNRRYYPKVAAKFQLNDIKNLEMADATIATSWPTAYAVRSHGKGHLFYFIQDFEPLFEPSGSYSSMAENTYKLGLHGITLGNWLEHKIKKQYGMLCDAIEFGVDEDLYTLGGSEERSGIFFYARPSTPRRGFELGILALKEVLKKRPDIVVHMAGADISDYNIPFPYVNHGILSPLELGKLYNQTIVGLVLSFSNLSLLPLEMLASGCTPVLNKADYTTDVPFSKMLRYAEPNPTSITKKLLQVIDSPPDVKTVKAFRASALSYNWSQSCKEFENILFRTLT